MAYTCKHCKYGLERTPDGQKPHPSTVWCSKRKIPMGQNRNVSCFAPLISPESRRCKDCRWAKRQIPSGTAPVIGKIWCEKRHFEINKQRTMECFE